ncbi:ParA family protein [Maribacter polysaccharolyticus]|uniref:ParA family protein n=1 Tax=Maribacter polysaccharolyticus TaxID=3020831 RepID=UPI00237F8DB8|nr:ParA family protein [Maribacter polysaccharolyticus]MDE3744024.1 ParA family protein [Maribacter polysaccharolyticus]
MVLAVVNRKGGVGKTTNTIHIGAGLAQSGKKVLMIDLDPQCDLTFGTGIREYSYNVEDFLKGTGNLKLRQKAMGFHVLPGSSDFIASRYDRAILKEAIEPLKEHFDYIMIDTPPATINSMELTPAEIALLACDYFLIPIEAKAYPVKNANSFLGSVFDHIEKHNPELKFLGFFFTNVLVTRKGITKYREMLDKGAGDLLFKNFIRTDVEIEKAVEKGLTIFQHRPHSRAGQDYNRLITELLEKMENYG